MKDRKPLITLGLMLTLLAAFASEAPAQADNTDRAGYTMWSGVAQSERWTAEALTALDQHGAALVETVPQDIHGWCPGYGQRTVQARQQFWIVFLSLLAEYESTHRPDAVGGDGRWYGLLQISPATARGYGCAATTGEALKNGVANLRCAIRIMADTVPRDGVVAQKDTQWRGVAADWGPLRSAQKRDRMKSRIGALEICAPGPVSRPRVRPKRAGE